MVVNDDGVGTRRTVSLQIRDGRLLDLIDQTAVLDTIATGFDFTEGPVWHPAEQSVLFSDIMGNSLYRWTAQDGITKQRVNSYMANGNAYDALGRLITCEHATSRLTRTDLATDTYDVLATQYDGKQLNSPNDVIVHSSGAIFFTDPLSGRSDGYGVPRPPALPFRGVYRLDPNGALTLLVADFELPNGLCFSQDEQVLFINDTRRQHIRRFDLTPDLTLTNGVIWAETTGELPGVPDGMKVDSLGNIYCTGPGGIQIFDRDAVCLGVILMPEKTANFVFGGDDYKTLFITASTSLYRVALKTAGHPTFTCT